MKKTLKVYQIILAVCGLIMGLLMIGVDFKARQLQSCEEKMLQKEDYYEMGNDLENYILDVVFETDIFDDITEEESEWLEYLIDDGEIGRYYIELIYLTGKYYGNIPSPAVK